jgi:CheY-like chemotaxis protein
MERSDIEVVEGRGQHVLYVDDEPRLARLEERRLTQLGYRITVVPDGKTALAAFLADPAAFDVVITDFTMPSMNGLELSRELTRIRPDIPVILSTGNVDNFPAEVCIEAGIRQVVTKPIRMKEISRALAEVLGILPEG